MKIQQIHTYSLTDCVIPPEKWNDFTRNKSTDEFIADEDFRERWLAPACLLFHPRQQRIYAGLTAFNGDVFYTFDPQTKRWDSLSYPAQGDPYENKIHQSLVMDEDGIIYGGTATLADVDIWPKARGGRIFRYDPVTGEYEFLCTLPEHDYVQTLVLDRQRSILYLSTFPGLRLFRFDLATRQLRLLTMLGSVSTEGLLLDAHGNLWHNYELMQWAGRFPLLHYNVEADRINYLNRDLPAGPERAARVAASGARNRGSLAPQIDLAITLPSGRSYIGTSWGDLVEVDPATREWKLLDNPYPTRRLKLVAGPDGWLFGLCGVRYESFLFAFEEATGKAHKLGRIETDDVRCWQPHHGAWVGPDTLYVAECDNHERSGYLFEVKLEI